MLIYISCTRQRSWPKPYSCKHYTCAVFNLSIYQMFKTFGWLYKPMRMHAIDGRCLLSIMPFIYDVIKGVILRLPQRLTWTTDCMWMCHSQMILIPESNCAGYRNIGQIRTLKSNNVKYSGHTRPNQLGGFTSPRTRGVYHHSIKEGTLTCLSGCTSPRSIALECRCAPTNGEHFGREPSLMKHASTMVTALYLTTLKDVQ